MEVKNVIQFDNIYKKFSFGVFYTKKFNIALITSTV